MCGEERTEFFAWLHNESCVDKLFQENNLEEIKRRMKWLRKAYYENVDEINGFYDLLRDEGYFYCPCCDKWKRVEDQ